MHSFLLPTVLIGLAVATALPVQLSTTTVRPSDAPLQAKILSSEGFQLTPENEVSSSEETTVSTNSDQPKTIETTTQSDKAFTNDFISSVKPESSVSSLTQLFRQPRSVTTESAAYDTTAAPFELDYDILQDGHFVAMILLNSVNVKLADLESEADFSFSTIQTIALLHRPVIESTLMEDSAACINVQDVILVMIEILDAFKPYVEAINNPYITVIHLRATLQDLVSSVVIPTSGTQIPVVEGTQETIYTLIALKYQMQIIQDVISNSQNCQ